MPHLVILYSYNLDGQADMTALCRQLADTMIAQRDEAGAPVFPPGGTRVLAYPAQHFAVADSERDYAFAYLNLRMKRGRSEATQQRIGDALLATARAAFEPIQTRRLVGVTLQIDLGDEVYDGKINNIHPLFQNLPPENSP
jgi:5-carboxymethyl-2-hydroxymuconate isomerase